MYHIAKTAFSFFACIAFAFLLPRCQSSKTEKEKTVNGITIIELPQPTPLSKAEFIRIDTNCRNWYDTVLAVKGFNGSMLVAKNGTIVFEKYNGTGHLPGKDTITAFTPFHVASVSKTFTAMAVLKLLQENKLVLDDELVNYFPQFNYPGVTIRTLLNHRSGIPNYPYFMDKLWDKTKYCSNEDVLHILITKKDSIENIAIPNTKFSYSNTNYALLALLIEKISGMKYADYMQQNIFTPLQMNNSFVFSLKDTLTQNPSYDWKGRLIKCNFLDSVYGDKNIYTTARDLLIWDRALAAGKIVNPEIQQLAYTPYSMEHAGVHNYGLGWRMSTFSNGKKIIYHNGWWHGNNACFIRLLQENATIIVIGNKFTRAIYTARQLSNLFGDYFMQEEEEEMENTKPADSLSVKKIKLPIETNTKKKFLQKKF